jgi:diguanylate cyclase (GGDEF)-like protein
VVRPWVDRFLRSESVILRDLEDIREKAPSTYAYLSPQGIHSLVVSPLTDHGSLIGFFGVDDPPRGSLDHIPEVFAITDSFVVCLLRRRDLVHRLEYLSLHDHLTGAGNRHALQRYFDSLNPLGSLGVVYADVTGLKRLNDTQGHRAGDELLIRASRCLGRVFPAYPVFRVGGDEFLVLCPRITQGALLERENRLRDCLLQQQVVLASGSAWYPTIAQDIDQLVLQAERRMYEAKRAYYQDAAHDRRRKRD